MSINFDAINARLLSDYLGILKQWLPNGKKIGAYWCAGSLNGEEGESLKVHARKGVWSDFATGEKGGDPVSLYAAIHGIGQGEAAKRLGGDTQPQPRATPTAFNPSLRSRHADSFRVSRSSAMSPAAPAPTTSRGRSST